MINPQFRFHEDLEFLTSPTDRIPTVLMTSIVQKKMQKETVCTEHRADFQEAPILARTPLLIFLCVFSLYLFLLLRGVNVLLYVMVMVGNRIAR